MNGLDPNLMTAEERLAEAAEILASGIVRWYRKRVEKSQKKANVSLELSSKESVNVSETIQKNGERP